MCSDAGLCRVDRNGGGEKWLVQDMFLKVKHQKNLLINWLWVMRERQDSKVTVNVWDDSLTEGDASVRVVDSLRVAGVLSLRDWF